MLTTLRRILLTQYIGAIITAYVAVQGVLSLIGVIGLMIALFIEPQSRRVLGGVSSRLSLDWNRVIGNLIQALLHLAVAGLLAWWLYLKEPGEPQTDPVEAEPDIGDLASDAQEP